MTGEVATLASPRSVDIPEPKDVQNPSTRFALTQLNRAEGLRSEAKVMMDEIAQTQEKQKEAGVMLDIFRRNQSDTAEGHGSAPNPKYQAITQEQIAWCRERGIELPSKVDKGDVLFNASEWDLVSKGVQAHIDRLGADTQQKMVMAQDNLGQFNALTQGANSSIQAGNETMKYAARGQ